MDDNSVDQTTVSDAGGSGSFSSDFGQAVLNGLGIGSGAQAAQTIGNLLRPAVAPNPAPAPAPTSAASVKKLVGSVSSTELVVIGLALAIGTYFVLRK